MLKSSSTEVRLAISLGDPRGIGPEVTRKALDYLKGELHAVTAVGPAEQSANFLGLEVVGGGGLGVEAGKAAGLAIERAAELALAGQVDAIVTAPVHKPALARAGFLPGHTEILRSLARVEQVGMLMCEEGESGRFAKRVLLATIHVPLADVPKLVTADLLVSQSRLLREALRSDWGIATPKIALCALNPHASDGKLFGSEEEEVYGPALEELATDNEDWTVAGPLPADTVFARAFAGEFDAVVAPYHDVGMSAFKTASFGRGVNVTLGLPFVRCSPDHGTAFDIAGKGSADPSSMVQAIRLAVRLARRRKRCAA